VPKPKTNAETEVVPTRQNDRRQRRRFSAEDKARILAEADACAERGQLGELLRREGIYSTHLTNWRAQLKREGVVGLVAKRRGPRPKRDDKDRVIEKLEKQNARLEKELRISKALIEMHKKAHEILGIALPRIEDSTEDDSWSSSESSRLGTRSWRRSGRLLASEHHAGHSPPRYAHRHPPRGPASTLLYKELTRLLSQTR